MSYSLTAYLMPLRSLEDIYGSGDVSLVDKITTRFQEKIEDYNDQLSEFIDNSGCSIQAAISDIIQGWIRYRNLPQYYGYALELICACVGSELPSDAFHHLNSSVFHTLERIPWIRDHFMSGQEYPVPIPPIPDFPCVRYVKISEAQTVLNDPPVYTGDDSDALAHFAEEAISQYVHWMKGVVSSRRYIVTFYY